MKKCLILFSTLFCLLSTSPRRVEAAAEFSTTWTSQYVIEESGHTTLTHQIALKNNLAHIYATEYSLATSGVDLQNLQASDESGPLTTTTASQNGVTTIHLTLERPKIGKDQVKTITLSYQADDVVEKIGPTMTVNIPRLAKANEADSYTRVVKIAGVTDLPTLISPPASKVEPDGEYQVYTFSGHQADSLSLLFGESATYHLNLKYELKNKELKDGFSELALPPDTAYQKVLLNSLTPEPSSISLDNDGNWLARYQIGSQDKLLVTADLYVTVYPLPKLSDPSDRTFQKTLHSKYWPTNSAVVNDLGAQLKTPANIYRYLVDNFTYNYGHQSSSATRQGAVQALSAPRNVLCTEFTDSFVALARSLQIPSREINGFGYTKNNLIQPSSDSTDILHAWPEYYDTASQTWVSVDPTWGNTTGGVDYFSKLDFSHITFVRHGQEDSYPLPAGAYKSNQTEKYLSIELAETTPDPVSTHEIRDGYLVNTGNVSLIHPELGYLPPYGQAKLSQSKSISLYDKIKALCANLFSKFWGRPPVSM